MPLRALPLVLLLLAPALAGCLAEDPAAAIALRVENRSHQAYELQASFQGQSGQILYTTPIKAVRGEVITHRTPLADGVYNLTLTVTHGPGSNEAADTGELEPYQGNTSLRAQVDGLACQGMAELVVLISDGPELILDDRRCSGP